MPIARTASEGPDAGATGSGSGAVRAGGGAVGAGAGDHRIAAGLHPAVPGAAVSAQAAPAARSADRGGCAGRVGAAEGGADADLAPRDVWSQLVDMSGTPPEQARRLLSLLFPSDVAESLYRQFGDIVAAARARLSPELVKRQAAAMDAWHRNGVGNRLREITQPVLIATGSEDIVIPPSNALKLVDTIPGAWLAQFPRGGHAFMAQYPRPLADLINCFLALE